MKDDLLIALLKGGLRSLDKELTKIVSSDNLKKNLQLRSKINETLYSLVEELYEGEIITDADSKKTFRRLKKEYKGQE